MNKLKCIDLFCGAGGSTTGVTDTGLVDVIACINHDNIAIRSHEANHPNCKHHTEDIRLFDESTLPKCDLLTISAECTHFSIAKGGESRNADSRTLSEELYRYIAHCEPSIVIVENVKEFLTWSDLVQKKDNKGNLVFKPNGEPYMIPNTDKNKLGSMYKLWVQTIKDMGYEYQSRLLNSADFGAYTSRLRYFGVFVKRGMKIKFPMPTHAKNPPKGTHIQKWKAVKELLDFSDKGNSIFDRKKPLSENTLKRIYAGLIKFCQLDESAWILKFLSNDPRTGVNKGITTNEPLHTISTQNRLGLATLEFIDEYKSRENAISSVNDPLKTITNEGGKSLVTAFVDRYYGNSNCNSIDEPLRTITTVDRFSLFQIEPEPFLMQDYSSGSNVSSIEKPCPAILTNPKSNLVQFLATENYANSGTDLNNPHPTIMACDKNTYLIQSEEKEPKYTIDAKDSEYTKKIKEFMRTRGISDIFMRMLCVDRELKVIQGFPKNYVLLGTRKDRKKFVGNSVVPLMMQRIVETIININQ